MPVVCWQGGENRSKADSKAICPVRVLEQSGSSNCNSPTIQPGGAARSFAESHSPCSMTSLSEYSIHWPSRARTTKSRLLDCTKYEKSTTIDTRCEDFDCGNSSELEVLTSLDRFPTASRQAPRTFANSKRCTRSFWSIAQLYFLRPNTYLVNQLANIL